MASIARVVFMLLGGALTDRLTPRFMMLLANLVRMLLSALLATAIIVDAVSVWTLYAIAFVFGLMDACFRPAYQSILPRLVAQERIPAGVALLVRRGRGRGHVGVRGVLWVGVGGRGGGGGRPLGRGCVVCAQLCARGRCRRP